ncbi:MAG: trypsin-like peptidase domain-containing protein [Planctomycetes bacterium]|nr:trypsin-like peptidase domain-containing protein [Planctomycetota bacterium]
MSRALLLLSPVLLACVATAQGVVNQSLLVAPDAPAPSSWSAETYQKVQGAVVYVAVEVDGPRGKFVIERASTGVVVDAKGLVVTFHRLVAEAAGASDKRLLVQLNDAANTRLAASIEKADPASGLALLRIAPPAGGLTAVPLRAQPARTGEPVLVVARPEGQELLAFAGCASAALAPVALGGQTFSPGDVFLCDARNDERCDGAPVVSADGALLGLYSSEHVQRDKSEPVLEDLQRPSFGVVLAGAVVHRAFPALAGDGEAAASVWADAVAKVAPSVVGVHGGGGSWPSLPADDPGAVQRRAGVGSGVVVTAGGLVVANLHVCEGDVKVRLADGTTCAAEIVARNMAANLALLQVALPAGRTLQPALLASDEDVRLGQTLIAVGNPLGTAVVASAGVLSALREREGGRIQADMNLGNQNGGGAVIDVAGRVVGIADAGLIDPLEWAFRTRGDRITQETNLSTFVGVRRVRQLFAGKVGELAAAPAAADATKSALTTMVERTSGALLNIYVARNTAEVDPDDPFPPDPQWMPMSLGSGVIIDESGLAISNWHVVDDATMPDGAMVDDHRVTARVFGGREYEVKVLSISREDDLSLLQLVLEPGEKVHAVELGSSDGLAIGEPVAAIGNPHGRANTITFGVVSAKDQGIRVKGRWAKLDNLIETDAAINGGNSGGALLDMNGRLVGINSAGGGTFNNKGYAIAVDHVRRQLLGLLFQPYKLRSPDFGMRVLDDEGRVLVMDVDPRGPAAAAGVASGDRVRSLGGVEITWSPGLARTLLEQTPGVDVELVVERRGEAETFTMAPLAPEVWSLLRQCDVRCRDFAYGDDPDRVRQASIALHRKFTGDATGEPRDIPPQVVQVDKVFAPAGQEIPLQVGDLILALELRDAQTGAPVLTRIGGVSELRDWFNHRELGSYDGVEWKCWIARGAEVQAVELRAKRLLW